MAAWGEMLKGGMIVALTADATETHLEGVYWLALITGAAFVVPEGDAVLHGSDRFQAGWLVVKAQWYQLETVSPRCYSLQTEERHLVVSEMIRLSGIRFDKVVKRSPRLGFSQFYHGT